MSDPVANLKRVIPHMWASVQGARAQEGPGTTIKLALLAVRPDGAGQVVVTLEADTFLQDLAEVAGLPKLEPMPPEQAIAKYEASKIHSRIRG
jgi:hypothetical protein